MSRFDKRGASCRRVTYVALLSAGLWAVGCIDTRFFDDIVPGPADGTGGTDSSDSALGNDTDSSGDSMEDTACPSSLTERLTIAEMAVDEDIRYLQPGYNIIPVESRVILARQPDGQPILAWLNADMSAVHVTPLTAGYARREEDIQVPGIDLGGLTAHDDGFALLTRRTDTGEPIAVDAEDAPDHAAVLVRYQDGAERFAVPLTGTDGLDQALDYSNYLRGQLQWNEEKYGAYFEIRAGLGFTDREGTYGDKLVYVDDTGSLVDGGWLFAAGTLTDIALLPESDDFTALALPDGLPAPGLNLIIDKETSVLLGREETWSGYNGGAFGGVVKLSSGGYVIAWASRGFDEGTGQAAREAHDAALLRLSSDRTPIGEVIWLTDTADIDEMNVHIAPYGPDRLLLIWNAVDHLDCSAAAGTCFGSYAGTYFQLFTLSGDPLSQSELISAPPTSEQALACYDNGDLAFAYVTDEPDYSDRLDNLYGGSPPLMRTIRIAHLKYCPNDAGD